MTSNFITKSFYITALLCMAFVCHGQIDIGVTLNINPPYTTQITDYVDQPGKITLLLRNNTNTVKTLFLRTAITGDNGISLYSDPVGKPTGKISLQPFQLYSVAYSELQSLFSTSKYKLTGITATDLIRKNGVPEGVYSICVRAYDYNTNLPLSSDAPQGCKTLIMANLEPPIPLLPADNGEVINAPLQNITFMWSTPAGAGPGTQYKLKIIELLNLGRSINDAYNTATTPPFFETTVSNTLFTFGPSQPKMIPGRHYVWAVTAISNSQKVAYKNGGLSEVRSFIFKDKDPEISLYYPTNGAKLPPSGGGGADANKFSFQWDYTNPGNKQYTEEVFAYEIKAGQSADDAVKNNPRINSDKEPHKTATFICGCNPDGKTYAWRVRIAEGNNTFFSPTWSFSVGKDPVSQNIKTFDFAGYPVVVTALQEKGQFIYSGSGTTTLYKDGPATTISFENLVIQPFNSVSKADRNAPAGAGLAGDTGTVYTDWRAVSGTGKVAIPPKADIPYAPPSWLDVAPQLSKTGLCFRFETLTITAALKVSLDNRLNVYKLVETLPTNGANVTGNFLWETTHLYLDKNDDYQMANYVGEVSTGFDYNNTFLSQEGFPLQLQTPAGDNKLRLSKTNDATLKLIPKLYLISRTAIKKPKFTFDGEFNISQQKNNRPGLNFSFSGQESFLFVVDIPKYGSTLTSNNSVYASFAKVQADISMFPAVTIPELQLTLTKEKDKYNFTYTKAIFDNNTGLTCNDAGPINYDMNLYDFDVKMTNATINLKNGVLSAMTITGAMQIPFLKISNTVITSVTAQGVQGTDVILDPNKTVVVYQNLDGDKCEMNKISAKLQVGGLEVSGMLNFSNTQNPNKNFNITNVPTADFYIQSNGDFGSPPGLQAYTAFQAAGTYNGFKFTPTSLTLSRVGGTNYSISLMGTVVLSDNLASNLPNSNFKTTVNFNVDDNTGGGPPANQTVSFGSDGVKAGHSDASSDFSVTLTYLDNDPVYGSGFMTDDYVTLRQPDNMKLHAKMLVAHAPDNFNYWFFEAGADNVPDIPIGVFDVGIYGFTGRLYYKMSHKGTNIIKDDYVPDNSKFIGIYGQTKLKTMTDNGVKFWGDVGLEIITTKSGLGSIKFRGNGEFVTLGVDKKGMVQAKDCELDFNWSPKEIFGNFTVIGNYMDAIAVNVNANFDITPKAFDLKANGSAYLFNNPAMSCGSVGMELTDQFVYVGGTFNLVNMNWDQDLGICHPRVSIQSSTTIGAHINYSPFYFQGEGDYNATLDVKGCHLHGSLGLDATAKIRFPNPTCVSAELDISTPWPFPDITFTAGISDGKIIWDNCF